MSDYTNTFDGQGKETRGDAILGADIDTQFDAIATAIATKIDKVGGATADNFADHAAGGALADSGVSATHFATLSSNAQDQFDATVLKIAAATDHDRAGVLQPYIGTATALNLASGRSDDTWYSCGPTGSGADVIWADLDNTPTTAQNILVTLRSTFDVQSSGQASGNMQLRVAKGATDVANTYILLWQMQYTHPVTGDKIDTMQLSIPVDSSNIFSFYLATGGSYDLTDWTDVELIYNGFYT